ncbi:Uncharacterised protein [Mycobacterium tuberculosis]|nr:Uncharacterised protein [Mycobacterium tuberculosis]
MTDPMHRVGEWHFDVVAGRQREHGFARRHAFDDMTSLARRLQRFAPAQAFAKRSVARTR